MTDTFGFLIFAFAAVLAFEAVNGWTDAPNAVATVVSTRALPPMVAVGMAAVLNLVGVLSGTAVAKTIGSGMIITAFCGVPFFLYLLRRARGAAY